MRIMKKLFKNSFIALAVLALGFSACTEQVEYSPAEMPANDQVYFSNTNASKLNIELETKSFDVAVNRIVTGASASVPVTVEADSLAQAWFEFPETVEFADSMATAVYTVTVKEGAVFEYEAYANISLALDSASATEYGNATFAFSVGVPAPWSEWKQTKGTYNFSLYVSGSYAIPVYYRNHMLDQTKAQYLLGFTAIGANEDVLVDVNKETGACQVGVHYFLDSSNYGPVYLSDMPNYPLTAGLTYDKYPCTYDAEYGLFSFNLIYFISEALGSSASGYFATGVETLQLDGYEAPYVPDYSFAMEFRGHYIDNAGVDNAVIATTKGADVAQYLMTVISASDNAQAAVTAMLKGELACDTLTEAGFYAYPMTESGNYKALAITFDAEGNPLEAFAKEFEFFMAGQENPWQSIGYAVYTDDIVLPAFSNQPMSYYVEVLENQDQPGLFRMVDPYGPEFPLYPYASSYADGTCIEIDATDPEGVWIAGWQSAGIDVQNNGLMSVTSMAWFQADAQGATKEDAKEAGLCGVYADSVITFPVDALFFTIEGTGKAYYANRNGAFKLDMTNLLESIPAEAAASRGVVARVMMELKAEAMGKVTRFKKIDSSFLTPMDFVVE